MNITDDNSRITDSFQKKTKTQKKEKFINKSLSLLKKNYSKVSFYSQILLI